MKLERLNKFLFIFFILLAIVNIILFLLGEINTISLTLNLVVTIMGIIIVMKNNQTNNNETADGDKP